MGLHTGVCEERDNDYFGPVVNRAARLEAAAHGGQVLVSGATAELLFETLPAGTGLRNLGLHRLRDLGRPEQVYQLEAGFLRASFPPLASLDNPELPNNLPALLSAFVGREQELADVRSLAGASRLVTLTGAGGGGKTRLALQAAVEMLDTVADGVWFADLASLTEPGQVPGAVAAALGLPDHGGRPLADSVSDALSGQDALILLDNCEHLVGAAAALCDQLIRQCPRVRVLATSREPLGIAGERVYRVPSLSLPPADIESAADAGASDAVRLFVDRARVHAPGFALDDSVAAAVATVCRRLDGIPLALELAAARLSAMSLRHLCERLGQRFRLLTGGGRTVLPRQQTLQATVEWSFDLLSRAERETIRRLSVFVGGFELEGAEAVCVTDETDAVDVLDLLGSLVDKSLVVAERGTASVRYRLLETIRQYSAQDLVKSADAAQVQQVRDRHADFLLDMVQAAGDDSLWLPRGGWLRRLDLEWDNLRAAFAHLAATARTEDVLRLGVSLHRFAISRGHAEVLGYLRAAVARSDQAPSALLASALLVTSRLTGVFLRFDASERATAREHAHQALSMARHLADRRVEAGALGLLAAAAYFDHDPGTMLSLAAQAAAVARETGDSQVIGEALSMQAIAYGDDARRLRLEALECFRRSGDDLFAANELHMLSGLDVRDGLIDAAGAHLTEAIELAEQLGDELFLFFFRSDLGIQLLLQGKYAEAAQVNRRNLLVARRIGVGLEVGEVVFGAACCATWQEDFPRAARLHGAADAEINAALELGTVVFSPAEQRLRESEQRKLRGLMGDDPFERAYQSGAGLSPGEAVQLALGRGAA